ncbi:hypothetical protein MTO96_036212, partial [Rhipicephalus appendiculatus]
DRPTSPVEAAEASPLRRQFGSHLRGPDWWYYVPSLPPIHEEHGPESEQRDGSAAVLTRWASAPLQTRAKSQGSGDGLEDAQRFPSLTRWTSGPIETLAESLMNSECFEEEQKFPKLTKWTSGPIDNLPESQKNSVCLEDVRRFARLTEWTSGPLSTPAQPRRDSLCFENEQQLPNLPSGANEALPESVGNSARLQDAQQGRLSSPKFPGRIPLVYVVAALVLIVLVPMACKVVFELLQDPDVPIDRVAMLVFIFAAIMFLPFVWYTALNYCDRAARPGVSPA